MGIMIVRMSVCLMPLGARRGIRSPETRIIPGCKLPCRCCELNLDPLQKQEPSLIPQEHCLFNSPTVVVARTCPYLKVNSMQVCTIITWVSEILQLLSMTRSLYILTEFLVSEIKGRVLIPYG